MFVKVLGYVLVGVVSLFCVVLLLRWFDGGGVGWLRYGWGAWCVVGGCVMCVVGVCEGVICCVLDIMCVWYVLVFAGVCVGVCMGVFVCGSFVMLGVYG